MEEDQPSSEDVYGATLSYLAFLLPYGLMITERLVCPVKHNQTHLSRIADQVRDRVKAVKVPRGVVMRQECEDDGDNVRLETGSEGVQPRGGC